MKCPTCGHDDAGQKFLVNANALNAAAAPQPLIVTSLTKAAGAPPMTTFFTMAPNVAGCAAQPFPFITTVTIT